MKKSWLVTLLILFVTFVVDAVEVKNLYTGKILVMDKNGLALTFSRAAVPFQRDRDNALSDVQSIYPYLRHIGIYAYRASFIKQYVGWPASKLEQVESLEQLRVLWHGEQIHVDHAVEPPPAGVDTPEDLEQVRRLVASLKQQ